MKEKILLLHGWNWRNYTKITDSKDAWDNRKEFVKKLEEYYEVYKLNFPGFCSSPEPGNKGWKLEDYAKYVKDYLNSNNLQVDYILGYSFGGAVAVKYSLLYDKNQKIILVSPAITRDKGKSKNMIKTPKFMRPIRNKLRDLYLIHIVKNNYMIHGTKFLNESYQNIVREELLEKLETLNPLNIKIIYGSEDEMVNPKYVIQNISDNFKNRIFVIDGGTHDIANTNPDDIIDIINNR